MNLKVERLTPHPIITPDLHPSIGDNINGPSLVRVPAWIERPLGTYYLYFAHHAGTFIRLAYADRLEGPWSIYAPGTLHLEDSLCEHHLASPDVHVDVERSEVRMYYHGPVREPECEDNGPEGRYPILGSQRSRVALAKDGLRFSVLPDILGASYFRVFRWNGFHYALGMPGIVYRSRDGLSGFEPGPVLFSVRMRHSALRIVGETLFVFYSNAGDCPERILLSTVDLRPDWLEWAASPPRTLLEPETDAEGADRPLVPSSRGRARGRVRQLRDPAVFEEDGKTYLLYSVAGESGIAIARLFGLEEGGR